MDHLIIPDVHVKAGQNLERLVWLGKYIVDAQPDVIICLGDFADMHSLSSYDVGKKSGENARYREDIAAAKLGMATLLAPLKIYNAKRKRNKKARYKPRMILTLGNHENRINRHINDNPVLEGLLSTDSLGYTEAGWEVYDYLKPVLIDGINYCHSFVSGVMARPIGGEHHATSLLNKQHTSCVVGHSHLRDFSERSTGDGRRIIGVVAGCYLDEWEDYAGPANLLWWKGIVQLNDLDGEGYADPEFISMNRLKEWYGNG